MQFRISRTHASHDSPAELLAGRKFLRQRVDPTDQVFLARHACDLVANLSVFEDQERGNRANIEFEGQVLVLVDVHLAYFNGAGFFARDLINEWCD
jgi:hypothetical protein